MIKLRKGPCPEVLQDNASKWTKELLAKLEIGFCSASDLPQRYKHRDIREALRAECYEKCMYCESRITHVSYDHIEHIKPKASDKYPELTYSWENLGLACQKCNITKGHEYDEEVPFINPYIDEPSDHFVACGCFLWHRPGDRRAELTEKKLELNRPPLIEQRKERVESLRSLADRYVSATNPNIKDVLRTELERELTPDKPYSFIARAALETLLDQRHSPTR